MNKEMLEEILETVTAYYLINRDVLSDDVIEDLKNQIKYLDELIKSI